jgi:cyclic pyranopterin phosphate synthase
MLAIRSSILCVAKAALSVPVSVSAPAGATLLTLSLSEFRRPLHCTSPRPHPHNEAARKKLDALFDVTRSMHTPSNKALVHDKVDACVAVNMGESRPRDVGNAEPSLEGTSASAAGSEFLTHVDKNGRATMVDVGHKRHSLRIAKASARVFLGATAFALVAENRASKGDVLTVAQVAGINAAKQTYLLIPLCHQLLLRKVSIDMSLDETARCVDIHATVKSEGQTGVEMEALVAASVAGLTIYDMCKAASKDIVVSDIRLEAKSGGKSADYVREKGT